MRYAIVSDIHANLQAWEAVRADLEELGVDGIICLGDVVGYGPSPAAVLAAVRATGAEVIMGNHDAAASGFMDPEEFNDEACQAIRWATGKLDAEGIAYLSCLPMVIAYDEFQTLVTHAEVKLPERFGYVLDEAEAREQMRGCKERLVFFGHTHLQGAFVVGSGRAEAWHGGEVMPVEAGKRYMVNPGSVGDPRDGRTEACYAIWDTDGEVLFRRVAFDIVAFRDEVASSGSPYKPFFLRLVDGDLGREVDLEEEARTLRLPVVAAPTQRRKIVLAGESGQVMAGKGTRRAGGLEHHVLPGVRSPVVGGKAGGGGGGGLWLAATIVVTVLVVGALGFVLAGGVGWVTEIVGGRSGGSGGEAASGMLGGEEAVEEVGGSGDGEEGGGDELAAGGGVAEGEEGAAQELAGGGEGVTGAEATPEELVAVEAEPEVEPEAEEQATSYLVAPAEHRAELWRYVEEQPEEGWAAIGFDDAMWLHGHAPFDGSGMEGDAIWVAGGRWLRRPIFLAGIPDGVVAVVRMEGIQSVTVWVNGEVAASFDGAGGGAQRSNFATAAFRGLRVGRNVVAVEAVVAAGVEGPLLDVALERLE